MLKFSEILEFSRENSYFERIRIVRMVRMVRMVRSLADRTFQLWSQRAAQPATRPAFRSPTQRAACRSALLAANVQAKTKKLKSYLY